MKITEKYPPLYACSVCGLPVTVIPVDGKEPEKIFKCGHTDAVIWANRKVTLRGEGELNTFHKAKIKITLTVRQFLSLLTGRSV